MEGRSRVIDYEDYEKMKEEHFELGGCVSCYLDEVEWKKFGSMKTASSSSNTLDWRCTKIPQQCE